MVAYALKGQGIKKKKKRGGVTFMCNKVARILQASPPPCKNASHCTPNNKSSVTIGKYSMVTLVLGAMIVFMKHIFFFFVFLNQCCILNWFGLNKTAKILLWDRERERKRENNREKSKQKITDKPCLGIQITMHSSHTQTERERERDRLKQGIHLSHIVLMVLFSPEHPTNLPPDGSCMSKRSNYKNTI